MENNKIVHKETSKIKSLNNREVLVEKRGVSVLENGGVCKIDRMTGLKFKRRNVFAVRDFPPGCGTGVERFGLRKMEDEEEEFEDE
ncbi:unnamed protein product [Arabidopsis lyrata]|uniref:Uncharacterized protein n=1 Tax=Arabidopsis lyrata subsp. lyrata TaxID=81972 RepID=D7LCU4_ARALL|nr:hypothetical protein ARALYDRAFT_901354 [Arabidopsis lyrata subsp. lyrata]CAH8263668.1 unnamed protein product [Arabidopsis lyrata]